VGCVQARVNEWSLLTLPSPIPELQHAPLPLKMLWATECAPTPPSFDVFYLDSHLNPSRNWECVTGHAFSNGKKRHVFDFFILNISILSHRIRKQAIMHKHNRSVSHSIRNLNLQLIYNMQKCPSIESFAQCRNKVSNIYKFNINLMIWTLS
jgi:hypothetical protein